MATRHRRQKVDEDMKQIRFSIPGQPFGKQRPKFSRAGAYVKTYTPKETTSYENLVKLFYNEAAKGRMFPESRFGTKRTDLSHVSRYASQEADLQRTRQ